MPFTNRVFNSIGEVDLTAWERVRSESGGSIFMDPRFIAAVETSMKENCRFWYVIVYDDNGRPAACACLTAMTIDLADLADPRLAWVIRRMPKLLSRFRKLKLFICGLPGSPGEKNLALISINSSAEILSVLDAVIRDLATETRSDAIVYKEFGKNDLEWTRPLLDLGYRQIPTPPMHFFKPSFRDFAEYCAALRTRYRQQINRSIRKLKEPGIRQAILTDPKEISRLYTAEVHGLYCQMAAKADAKLEILPIEFFRQLMLRLEGDVDLLVIFKEFEDHRVRLVSACWIILSPVVCRPRLRAQRRVGSVLQPDVRGPRSRVAETRVDDPRRAIGRRVQGEDRLS